MLFLVTSKILLWQRLKCIKSLFQLSGHYGLITSASKMSSGFDFPEVSKVTKKTSNFYVPRKYSWTHNTHIMPKSGPKSFCRRNLYVQTVTQRKHFRTSVDKTFLHRIHYSNCWHTGWQYGMGISIPGYIILKVMHDSFPRKTNHEPACLYLSVKCITVLKFFTDRVAGFSHRRVTFINNLASFFVSLNLRGWRLHL